MPDVVRLQTEEVAVKGQKMAKPAKSKIKRKRVTLTLEAPNAEAFWLMGDFNQWNQKAHPMKQEGDGLDPCKKGFFGRHPLGQFDGRVMNRPEIEPGGISFPSIGSPNTLNILPKRSLPTDAVRGITHDKPRSGHDILKFLFEKGQPVHLFRIKPIRLIHCTDPLSQPLQFLFHIDQAVQHHVAKIG